MKKIHVLALTLLLVLSATIVKAQKVKLESGNLKALASVSAINVEYDYSQMSVGKYKKEEDYISRKKADYNKKEEGRGEQWEQAWIADRSNRFQPQFEELFEKHSGKEIGAYPEAKYTMIFKTTRTEPGYNIGISRKNAEIDAIVYIVETANRNKVIATFRVTKSPGRTFGGYDYDTGTRLQESYAAAGKALGNYIKKKAK